MPPSGSKRGRRISDPFRFDQSLLSEVGASHDGAPDLRLAGVDEAGRGCLAGPLVAAAVVLDYSSAPFGGLERLTDSKLMTPEARQNAYPVILRRAARVSCVAFSPASIDRIGLHRCNMSALGKGLESLAGAYCLAVVDAFDLKRPELNARPIIGADYKSAAVAAASVVAKVVRDRLMRSLAAEYPVYGFEEHVGYGTHRHREALRAYGPCAIHRLSFRGVACPQLELWDDRLEPGESGHTIDGPAFGESGAPDQAIR
jgi:ribonuclease HII